MNINKVYFLYITKTRIYNFDSFKPLFYIEKTGLYRSIYIFFLFLLKTIDFGYLLEPPHRGGSYEYAQSVLSRSKKNIKSFLSQNFPFFGCKIFNIFEQACFRNEKKEKYIHCRTSMAQTSLGPWKFVRGMSSSSHSRLIRSGSIWRFFRASRQ